MTEVVAFSELLHFLGDKAPDGILNYLDAISTRRMLIIWFFIDIYSIIVNFYELYEMESIWGLGKSYSTGCCYINNNDICIGFAEEINFDIYAMGQIMRIFLIFSIIGTFGRIVSLCIPLLIMLLCTMLLPITFVLDFLCLSSFMSFIFWEDKDGMPQVTSNWCSCMSSYFPSFGQEIEFFIGSFNGNNLNQGIIMKNVMKFMRIMNWIAGGLGLYILLGVFNVVDNKVSGGTQYTYISTGCTTYDETDLGTKYVDINATDMIYLCVTHLCSVLDFFILIFIFCICKKS